MSLDVWFAEDVTRAIRALRLAGEANRDIPEYCLTEQEAAYREGFEKGYNAALLAVAASFGVERGESDGFALVVARRS